MRNKAAGSGDEPKAGKKKKQKRKEKISGGGGVHCDTSWSNRGSHRGLTGVMSVLPVENRKEASSGPHAAGLRGCRCTCTLTRTESYSSHLGLRKKKKSWEVG